MSIRRVLVSRLRRLIRFIGGSLVARAALAGAAVLALGYALLVFTPIEVSTAVHPGQAALLLAGVVAMIAIQLLLVRRALAPVRRLAEQMQSVNLHEPKALRPEGAAAGAEIAAFVRAFNDMVERLAEERRHSARGALMAQEGERLRTARELHDEVGQSMTAIALQVEHLAGTAEPATAARLRELSAQLQKSLDDVRRIVRELRPEALDDLGLVNALIALTSRMDRQTNLSVTRDLASDLPSLTAEQELVLYRVAQEALTNAIRHADAATASVALTAGDGAAILVVSDDGRGMWPAEAQPGNGIDGMRERAMLVTARLSITSRPAQGTTVRLVVPVGAELRDRVNGAS